MHPKANKFATPSLKIRGFDNALRHELKQLQKRRQQQQWYSTWWKIMR
jgi:hypothetical protein